MPRHVGATVGAPEREGERDCDIAGATEKDDCRDGKGATVGAGAGPAGVGEENVPTGVLVAVTGGPTGVRVAVTGGVTVPVATPVVGGACPRRRLLAKSLA